MNFSIIIPVYNEQENISILVSEIQETLSNFKKNFEIIIVDDGSKDDTLKIVNNLNQSNIKIIQNLNNHGQSYSIKVGINNANYSTIITIDGDLQNNPADIPKMLSIYIDNDFKLVGGIRKNRKDNKIKLISSFFANYIRKTILKDDCIDTGCSLKIFDKQVFLSFPYFDGMHRFLPALFKGFGHKTFFIDVDHRRRYKGFSKYGTLSRLYWGIRDIYKVLKIIKNK